MGGLAKDASQRKCFRHKCQLIVSVCISLTGSVSLHRIMRNSDRPFFETGISAGWSNG